MCSSSSTTTSPRSLVSCSFLVSLLGCASHLPQPRDPGERALFHDLERQISVAQATGWGPDKLEVDEIVKASLDSVCRVHPLARRALGDWLRAELRGRDPEAAWRANGKDLASIEELLTLTRIGKLLARAEELSGECPFWLEIEDPFRGRQISNHTWSLVVAGGGKGIGVRQGNRDDLSFGGAGRVLLGRVFDEDHALYAGVEIGASAAFPKDDTGARTALVIGLDLVAPVVYRQGLTTNTYWEVEAGPMMRTNETDWSRYDPGVHAGVTFGGRALRQRWVFPGAAFGISIERTFEDDVTLVKLGGRVTFDADL